jgi:hypothetical protein
MSIKEIKDILGIDITEKCRNEVNILLKTIYIMENQHKTLYELSDELKITYCSVFNLRKKYLSKVNKSEMIVVRKAYDTRDRLQLNYLKGIKASVKIGGKLKHLHKVTDRKLSMVQVCDILREDKYSYLNNKTLNSWRQLDWNVLKTINEEKYNKYYEQKRTEL